MWKRGLSLTLAVILLSAVFTALPLSARAEESSEKSVTEELVPIAAEAEIADELVDISAQEQPAPVAEENPYPVIAKIENTDSGARISWQTYQGNSYYRVYRLAENGWVRLATVKGNSYTDTTVANLENRVYTLRCVSGADGGQFTSGFYAEGWENTFFAPPVIDSLTNTVEGVHLKWTVAQGAQLYRVYRKLSGGAWNRLDQVAEGDYVDQTAVSGTAYTYTIRMITADGEAFMSGHTGGKSITFVAAPQITGVDNGDKGAVIRWNASKGAAAYRVYYKNDNSWVRLGQTTATSFTDTTVKHNEARVYTVRCVNKDNNFVSDFYRDNAPHTYIHYPAPVIASLESTFDGVLVKWVREEGAEDYRVYRKAEGEKSWTRLAQTDQSEYLDTTAASGVTYHYTLRMITADGTRFMSDHNSGKSIVCVAPPRITGFENTGSGAKVLWTKTAGAAAYRLFYRKNDAWVKLADVKTNSYTDTTVTNGETRSYTVRALDKSGNYSSDYHAEGWENTFFAAPVITGIDKRDDGVHLAWVRTDGAKDYRVYRKISGKSWERLGQTDGNKYVDTTAKNGVTYVYTLRLVDPATDTFMSDYLPGESVIFCDTPQISSLTVLENGVKLTWEPVQYAINYLVFYRDGGNWTQLASVKTNEYTDAAVADGETRVYTVRCFDNNNKPMSDYDRVGKSASFYAPPVIASVTKTDGGHNLVAWQAREGVAAYRLYRKSPGGSWARLFDSTPENQYSDPSAAAHIYTYTLRYLDAEGNLISDYTNDTKYYYNGQLADGELTVDGQTFHFDKGVLKSGFVTIDGKKYYYGSDGQIVKNNVVGSDALGWYYADASGVCCESEEIRLAAAFLMKNCKGSTLKERMKYGFMYMANNFPYHRYYDPPKKASDMPHLAIETFKNHNANCYRYAAAYCCLARMAGYRARVAVGITGNAPHGWTEVYVDGKWLICDVDANLPSYGNAAYRAYMMTTHFWPLSKYFTAELTIENGKAVWK